MEEYCKSGREDINLTKAQCSALLFSFGLDCNGDKKGVLTERIKEKAVRLIPDYLNYHWSIQPSTEGIEDAGFDAEAQSETMTSWRNPKPCHKG